MQKIFKVKDGKIEFTKEELKALLDEVYSTGYEAGKMENWAWNSPWTLTNSPYCNYNTVNCSSPFNIDLNSTGAKISNE